MENLIQVKFILWTDESDLKTSYTIIYYASANFTCLSHFHSTEHCNLHHLPERYLFLVNNFTLTGITRDLMFVSFRQGLAWLTGSRAQPFMEAPRGKSPRSPWNFMHLQIKLVRQKKFLRTESTLNLNAYF